MESLITGIPDQFGVLEIAIREQVNFTRLFDAQAMGTGIRAPACHILCP
jgi:hypothetical protein